MKAALAVSSTAPLLNDAMATFATETSLLAGASWLDNDRRKAPAIHLTPRQAEVLSLLCEGLPNKLICRQLNMAMGTVKVHIGGILRQLGVTSRLQAVVAARRCGLVVGSAPATPARAGTSAPPTQRATGAGASRSARRDALAAG